MTRQAGDYRKERVSGNGVRLQPPNSLHRQWLACTLVASLDTEPDLSYTDRKSEDRTLG